MLCAGTVLRLTACCIFSTFTILGTEEGAVRHTKPSVCCCVDASCGPGPEFGMHPDTRSAHAPHVHLACAAQGAICRAGTKAQDAAQRGASAAARTATHTTTSPTPWCLQMPKVRSLERCSCAQVRARILTEPSGSVLFSKKQKLHEQNEPSFILSVKSFAGSKPGYVFKEGASGIGYYRDRAHTNYPGSAAHARDSVICAVALGKADLVAAAVAQGCNVNETDVERNSCLHLAAKQGRVDMLRILLEAAPMLPRKTRRAARAFGWLCGTSTKQQSSCCCRP